MAYVVTRRCLIGHWREPGEVLTSEDLYRRNVRHMEDVDRCIRFDPSIPEPTVAPDDSGKDRTSAGNAKPSRGRRKAVADDSDQSTDEPSNEG